MIFGLLKKQKSRIYSGLFLLLIISGFCVTAALFLSLGKLSTLHRQSDEIRATMSEWQEKAEFINGQRYRPVLAAQIESVSSDLFVAAETHHMELVSYQAMQRGSHDDMAFQTFALSVKGSYTDNIAFLENFHAKDALITIMSMKMYPVEGNIQTDLRYRVYIK